jgi:hypothetical protein
LRLSIVAKGAVAKGQKLMSKDIADIRDIDFPGIQIAETDAILLVMKVGWKFALHYDLHRVTDANYRLPLETFKKRVAALWRYLTFEHVYRTLEARDLHARGVSGTGSFGDTLLNS